MTTIFLSESNVNNFIGKKITWTAESAQSKPYSGVAVIKSVDMTKRNPLECETIEGDDLSFAFLDNHGLKQVEDGRFTVSKNDKCLSYSDNYREIEILCE